MANRDNRQHAEFDADLKSFDDLLKSTSLQDITPEFADEMLATLNEINAGMASTVASNDQLLALSRISDTPNRVEARISVDPSSQKGDNLGNSIMRKIEDGRSPVMGDFQKSLRKFLKEER